VKSAYTGPVLLDGGTGTTQSVDIYLATVVVLTRLLRQAPMNDPWKNVLGYASPLLVVALVAVIFRNAIHPAFAWSNALLFFAR
jgi:hypothetical protein